MDYFVLEEKYDETHVFLMPHNITKGYQLDEGVSRQNGWPEDAYFQYAEHRKEGMILTDWAKNIDEWLVVSDRFKQLLQQKEIPYLEFLRVQIRNHKGKPVDDDYWIVNFIKHHEGVDRNKSDFDEDLGNEGEIFSFDKLVLSQEILDLSPLIFMLKEQAGVVVVSAGLAEELRSAEFTGFRLVPVDEYKTIEY